MYTSQGSPQQWNQLDVCRDGRLIYFEELAHRIVGADKSQTCGAGWRPRGELM